MPRKQSVNNVDSIDDIETEVADLKILIQALEFDVDDSPFTTAEVLALKTFDHLKPVMLV